MKRKLTKFWMDTPVGKLEFTRWNAFTWGLCGTEGLKFNTRSRRLDKELPTSREVVFAFGWDTIPSTPYGMVYEEDARVLGFKRHWYTAQALNEGLGQPESRVEVGMNRRKGDQPKPEKI